MNISIHKIIVFFFNISIAIGCVVCFAGVLSPSIRSYSYILSYISGMLGIVLYILHESQKRRILSKFFIGAVCIGLYMVLVGILSNSVSVRNNIGIYLSQDLRYYMYILMGIVMSDENYRKDYITTMKLLGIVSIIAFFVALANYSFSYSLVVQQARIGIWDIPYYCWWIAGACYTYLFSYSLITGKDKIIGYGSFAAYAILGLLFLKRSALVNTVLLLLISLIIKTRGNTRKIMKILFVVFVGVIVIIIAYNYFIPKESYFHAVIEGLLNRFSGTSLADYDRSRESAYYLDHVPWWRVILGQGLGNYFPYSNSSGVINALHIGLYDILYKGGIVYAFLWIYAFVSSIKCIVNVRRLSEMEIVCLIVMVATFVALVYEKSFTYAIDPIGFSFAIGIVCKKEYRYRRIKDNCFPPQSNGRQTGNNLNLSHIQKNDITELS